MDLNIIKEAFDRVTKKEKLSYLKCHEIIDKINLELEQALAKLQSCKGHAHDNESIFSDLKTKLKNISPINQLEPTQRELNIAFTKYAKLLEKSFIPDISKACRKVDFDSHTINHVIASHLYREGLFDISDDFIREVGDLEASSLKLPFTELYNILEAMANQDLQPALQWATTNSDKLKQNGSDLELKLHRLRFVEILQNQTKEEALNYARTHLAPFASTHIATVQKLMASLLWAGRLDSSPYSELLAPTHWAQLAQELTKELCNLLGQPYQSPLSVTLSAGVQSLPTLLKMVSVMVGKEEEWQNAKKLPVAVDLDSEFQFHSVFVCPVSKEQGSDKNPPMLMSCGHVLCQDSISKMSRANTRPFKCPYCPKDVIQPTECKRLYF